MFEYYIELCEKPKYLLTISEELFIEVFPFLCLAAIAAAVVVVAWIVDIIKHHK